MLPLFVFLLRWKILEAHRRNVSKQSFKVQENILKLRPKIHSCQTYSKKLQEHSLQRKFQ